ncbi:MAG: hopanoid biosynthesis protein HpnM [Alphaproteobacteria bacterium]|nr:hopanoid biosynthesis protein HpnM [Alphaproteobacteria bacterium]
MIRRLFRPILSSVAACSVAIVLFSGAAFSAARADNGSPRALIDGFHANILETMKAGPSLGYAGRYTRLLPAVEHTFHLPVMIQVAVGSVSWTRATPAQQQALIAAWTRFSTGTYAKNFKSFGGERFETINERAGPQGTTLIDTHLIKSDGGKVEISYVLKPSPNGWKVVDVIVDRGISELALRRSEFSRDIGAGGPDTLIATLTRKTDEYAAEK